MSITIRTATAEDISLVVDYNHALATETENIELDSARLTAGVTALIDDARRGIYYLAELDGEIVGQTMITLEWSDWRNGDFWWIQSVYVKPTFRGTGVFGALYRHIEQQARTTDAVCGIRLYVDQKNQNAADIYRALGMHDSNYDLLEIDFTK